MTRIGYARVSAEDQDHATQEARLKEAGCTIIRKEKASGGSRKGRDELAAILEFVRPGDELVVVKLDRLGRSTRDVLNLVHELEEKGAGLRVLEPEFSTNTDTGRILVTVLGMVAEMERKFIRERQQVGIEAAKAKGVYRGRMPSVPVEKVVQMHEEKHGPGAIAEALGISRMSVYRVITAHEQIKLSRNGVERIDNGSTKYRLEDGRKDTTAQARNNFQAASAEAEQELANLGGDDEAS